MAHFHTDLEITIQEKHEIDYIQFGKGLQQVYILSLYLINLYEQREADWRKKNMVLKLEEETCSILVLLFE